MPRDVARGQAANAATQRLDAGFFKVQFDRLTVKEREYVIAMTKLGPGPYRSAKVAAVLGESSQRFGTVRSRIIKKGVIFSPSYGDVDFTVPKFHDYVMRNFGR